MNKCTINDVAKTIGSGITPSRSNNAFWSNPKYPWLKTEQLGTFQIFDTDEYISQAAIDETNIKIWPSKTISVAMYGEGKTRGNVSIIMREMATNQACCNIIVNENIVDYRYVYYWLKSNYYQLRELSSGVRKNLNADDIKSFPIILPDLPVQKKIADVLYVIDQKIELNNRIIVELEAMAKTIYDYWFVQFNFPNAEGKPYRFSGGEMVWNEQLKREIPKGWNVGTIKPFINVIRGVTYEKDDVQDAQSSGYICLLRANNIANGNINYDNVVYVKENKISKEQLLMQNDVFICMSSGSKDHIGKTAIVTADIGCSFGAFCSKIEIQSCAFSWLALYFRSKYFNSYIRNTCLGTNINNLNNDMLYNIVLPIPPEYVLQRFNAIIHPMIAKMGNTHVESIELEHLRDWLLPMLMNGQVNVK